MMDPYGGHRVAAQAAHVSLSDVDTATTAMMARAAVGATIIFKGTGRGRSWSKEPEGALLTLYGASLGPDEDRAFFALVAIARMALDAVPSVRCTLLPRIHADGRRAWQLRARADAEDLAVFRGGPMHLAAVRKVRQLLSRGLDVCGWV